MTCTGAAGGAPAQAVYDALEACFTPWKYSDIFPKKGLQYHNADVIRKVYVATFASVPVLRQVLETGERDVLLFTHHPVPPKKDETGDYGVIPPALLAAMAERGVSLFSYHIPMDCHPVYSPARTLALALGMEPYEPFYPQNNGYIGVLCRSPFQTAGEVRRRLEEVLGHRTSRYDFGGDALPGGQAAIMPGGARSTEIYRELRERDIRLFITGVTNERIDWVRAAHQEARRWGVTILGGTHCSTEMFGARALAPFFRDLGLDTQYVPDAPNLDDL